MSNLTYPKKLQNLAARLSAAGFLTPHFVVSPWLVCA
nr:MAG TPA: hypothetical protein [Caudoviricetes sp.]